MPRDKTNKMTVCPAKTQISLGIRPVCSESSLWAQWVAKDPSFLHADSDDSDQTGWSLRWVHMPFCWFCHEAAQLNIIKIELGAMTRHLHQYHNYCHCVSLCLSVPECVHVCVSVCDYLNYYQSLWPCLSVHVCVCLCPTQSCSFPPIELA